jgi:hypothetical protein
MRSSLFASVDVTEFQTTDAYSILGLTRVNDDDDDDNNNNNNNNNNNYCVVIEILISSLQSMVYKGDSVTRGVDFSDSISRLLVR